MLTLLETKTKRSRNLIVLFSLTCAVVFAFVSGVQAQEGGLTIHAIDGRTGKPIKNEHLVVSVGATETRALGGWKNINLTTDDNGVAVLSADDAHSPFIQVWVDFHAQCQNAPSTSFFKVVEIQKSGVNAGNLCGKITREVTPGNFVVFARPATFWEKMRW